MAVSGGLLAESRPPVPSAVLGTLIFLATEVMFFAALISAFLVLRAEAVIWPPPGQPRLPVGITGLNTAVLLASGWTAYRALLASRRADGGLVARLATTAALGGLFLAVQGFEWVRLVHFGLTMSSSTYGGTFYALVGAHALHVLAALTALLVVLRRAAGGRYGEEPDGGLTAVGLYWLFVVAVWPVLYGLVYLA